MVCYDKRRSGIFRSYHCLYHKKSINSDPNQRATATTSQQIDKLKPIFMKIANEDGCEISDVLVRYMDLSSQAAAEKAAREQADTVDLGSLLKM